MSDPMDMDGLEDLPPAEDPRIGQTLGGRYRITRKLGGGGMGSVYEAEHTMIGARFAIKLLHVAYATDANVVKRFMNEARAAGMLGHPNILKATDMGRADDGSPFAVLELLEGNDLGDEIKNVGPMPVGRAVRILLQAGSALSAAHARGIVHRDMKPDNIFLTREHGKPDHVKVLDFGISKFTASLASSPGTATGSMMGTPYYMAPEQAKDASKVDARADVYAIGAILYEMLTGRVPFPADSLPILVMKIMVEEPRPVSDFRSDVPGELVDAIGKAMAKSPDERFATMADLVSAIEPFAGVETEPGVEEPADTHRATALAATPMATESMRPDAPTPTKQRSAVLPVLGGLAILGGVVAAAYLVLGMGEEPVEEIAPVADEPVEAEEEEAPTTEEQEPPAAPATVTFDVSSPHDGGEVELRGETHALPFQVELAPTSHRESVTVRARRRQGKSFWLTFDESHTLHVVLPRGRGVARASETELAQWAAGTGERVETERPTTTMRRPSSQMRGLIGVSAFDVGPSIMEPAPTVVPMELRRPAMTTAPSPMMRRGGEVYEGPSGTIPDDI